MRDEQPNYNGLKVAVATVFTWLGLSGFSDAVFEWRDWYEHGVMVHWRYVKHLADQWIFFWVPFDLPSWLIDYLVLGAVFTRSFIISLTKMSREFLVYGERKDLQARIDLDNGITVLTRRLVNLLKYPVAMTILLILIAPLWPYLLLRAMHQEMKESVHLYLHSDKLKAPPNHEKILEIYGSKQVYEFMETEREATRQKYGELLKIFLCSCLSFIPLLFLLTNEIPQILTSVVGGSTP